MSPQLGQGANLALVDAWVLADMPAPAASSPLAAYTAPPPRPRALLRAGRAGCSRPSSSPASASSPRRATCSPRPLGRVPFVRDQMLAALAGARTSPFSELDDLP